MALIQVSQISSESKVCEDKMAAFFYKRTVNNRHIVTDMELILGQLITYDKMKLV